MKALQGTNQRAMQFGAQHNTGMRGEGDAIFAVGVGLVVSDPVVGWRRIIGFVKHNEPLTTHCGRLRSSKRRLEDTTNRTQVLVMKRWAVETEAMLQLLLVEDNLKLRPALAQGLEATREVAICN